jgi:hypothetical protein
VSRRVVIAYWLIPAEPAHRFFQDLINDLARRYDAPVFEPHVTIYVGANRTDALETVLSKAAQDCEPIVLQALEVSHSDEFIKTLVVEFGLTRNCCRSIKSFVAPHKIRPITISSHT